MPPRRRSSAKQASEKDKTDHPPQPPRQSGTAGRIPWTSILFTAITAACAIVATQNPEAIQNLFGQWFDFPENTLYGVRPSAAVELGADIARRDAVVAAFKHAWGAYERDALGCDEYHPIEKKGSNLTTAGGIGYTVADALDTMMLMNLTEETSRARKWVADRLSFDRDGIFNTFETTIRVLGGLLSAYHLSGKDPVYLEKAVDLADRILPTFETQSGLPWTMINLGRKEAVPDTDNNEWVSTAEVATLQLEFKYLSFLTDDDVYWKKAEKVMEVLKRALPKPALVSIFLEPQEGKFVTSSVRLGSRADSYYEYLLKQYVQTAREENVYRELYEDSVSAINKHLIQRSLGNSLLYTAELNPEREGNGFQWRLVPKQDHLVCFLGGNLLLGAVTTAPGSVSVPPKPSQLTETGQRDWRTGIELIRTCMNTHETKTGLAPEIVFFRTANDGLSSSAPPDWYIKGAKPGAAPPLDARYILRPETIESLFIAFRLTGDVRFREAGWKIFQAIEKHCRIESGGYASVTNVDELPAVHEDKMETFLLGETFKYLYLLFEDSSVLPLSKYVFNTEAHPFPIFSPTIRTGFS